MAKNIKITQIKSVIDRPEDQKRTIKALGIKKLNHYVVHEDSPQLRGMIRKINHLVKVESA